MSLIDLFKGFHHEATQQEFPPSARVLFYTLLGEFNDAFWIDSLVFSERDLIKITGLKKTTLHEAKHFLTSRHFIKCKLFKNKTAYSFDGDIAKILAATTKRPLTDQSPTTNRPVADQFGVLPNTHTREDVKTEDVKTKSVGYASARANVEEINELIEYWSDELGGGRLTFEHQSKLVVFLERYGVEWVKAAMNESADVNHDRHGVKPKLLFAILENKAKPKQQLRLLKGGERNGRKFAVEADPRSEFVFDD